MQRNIVVIDSDEREGVDFIAGVKDSTGEKWDLIVKNAVLAAARKMKEDKKLRDEMARSAREYYKERFTIYSVGHEIGKLLK